MTLKDKLQILLGQQLYKHSKHVDAFLEAIMQDGNILGTTDDGIFLHLELHKHFYKLWLANAWYADLTTCFEANQAGAVDDFLYHMLRPSRTVKLRFWKWLEGKGISPLHDDDYESTQIRNSISSAIFA